MKKHIVLRSQKPEYLLRGFTLMELMMAIILFSILAVAIYSSLAVGIKAQRRGSFIGEEYGDMSLTMDKLSKDLRTAVKINDEKLKSEDSRMYFYSIQQLSGRPPQIYKITYSWQRDEDKYTLKRLQQSYIESISGGGKAGDELLNNIEEIDFDFGYLKKDISGEEVMVWKEEWIAEDMPELVRVDIEMNEQEFSRIIFCPAGRMGIITEE